MMTDLMNDEQETTEDMTLGTAIGVGLKEGLLKTVAGEGTREEGTTTVIAVGDILKKQP
jgi:hypothetical protein